MEISEATEEDQETKHAYSSALNNSTQEKTPQPEAEAGPPHDALFLSLAYLPVFELLSMSEVCVSLRDSVKRDDVLPWLNFVVQWPLNNRLSDESLIRTASMARGKLTTLALFNCHKITDSGLQWIVERNPLIVKV